MLKHNSLSQRRSTQPTNTLHLACGEKYIASPPTFLHKDVYKALGFSRFLRV